MWGIDILGPFSQSLRQKKFLIVACDYFTKWIEAETMAKIDSKKVEEFIWRDIICRFGIPNVIVVDNGR